MIDEKILKNFRLKNVLVTGGTGLIGRQIVSILCDAGAFVTSVSLDHMDHENPKCRSRYGDLTDYNLCKEMTKNMEYVFHTAGIKGSIEVTTLKPASFFVPMLMMNTNVLESCRINSVKKVVYTSSIGAYAPSRLFRETDTIWNPGEPMDSYPGWVKRMAELQIKSYQIQYGLNNFHIVRPCNVYGPGDNFDKNNAMVIPSLMCRIHSGENPLKVWGDGEAVRDFAFSKDVAEGIILTAYYGTGTYPFLNLSSGKQYSIKELIETLHSFIDFKYEFDTSKNTGFSMRVMDISAAKRYLKYNPTTPLLDGLKETWEWYNKNVDESEHRKNYFKES